MRQTQVTKKQKKELSFGEEFVEAMEKSLEDLKNGRFTIRL
jgi:hypothetical protein